MSELAYTCNQYCNLLPLCRSIALFAMKAHQLVFRVRSRFAQCAPYSMTRIALIIMAAIKQNLLQLKGGLWWLWLVLDNIQAYTWLRDQWIGTANIMITGTGATTIVIEDCPPDAFKKEALLAKQTDPNLGRKSLMREDILGTIDWSHINTVISLH